MNSHIFGATSSPAVAKYALRRAALDNAADFSSAAVDTVLRSFYMDDCLKSASLTTEEAIELVFELIEMLQLGGFRLTTWTSPDRELLNAIPEAYRAKNLKEVNLDYDTLPADKALGVLWLVDSDLLGLHISMPNKPTNRRGRWLALFVNETL